MKYPYPVYRYKTLFNFLSIYLSRYIYKIYKISFLTAILRNYLTDFSTSYIISIARFLDTRSVILAQYTYRISTGYRNTI